MILNDFYDVGTHKGFMPW